MIREQRLDPVVHYLEVRGAQPVEELGARFAAALDDGVRWLIVDLQRAELDPAAEGPLAALGCELRDREGELILVSSAPQVADAVARYEPHDAAGRGRQRRPGADHPQAAPPQDRASHPA